MNTKEKVGLLVSILGASASVTGAAQAAEPAPSVEPAVAQASSVEVSVLDTLINLVKAAIKMEPPPN